MRPYSLTHQEVLEIITRWCPDSLTTYLACIDRSDDAGYAVFTPVLLRRELFTDVPVFTKHVRNLARQDLLKWYEIDDGVLVKLKNFTN